MSAMTSFKRKRIEKWCEEVAQYLLDGTICKTVIGTVADDSTTSGLAYNGTLRIHPTAGGDITENILENFAIINSRNPVNSNNVGLSISSKNLNAKVDLAFKKASQALIPNDISGLAVTNGGTGTTDGSVNINGSFPVVKFAYSHYHEQRRKIDRLVQGLPVLNANGVTTMERPSSKCSTEDHVPIIIVNGEEPVRSAHNRSRSSSQPRRSDQQPQQSSRYSKNSGVATGISTSSNTLHKIQSPLTARRHNTNNNIDTPPCSGNPAHRGGNSGNNNAKVMDSRHHVSNNQVTPSFSLDPGASMTANERIARSKTAPAPNRNLHRARQRILSRRGNRVLEHTSQIPLQNCWAMAELTW